MSRKCGIYKITSPSGRIYIGQSIDIIARFRAYRNGAAKQQTLLGRSFKKYGYKNHLFEIIEECSVGALNEREIHYISTYDTFNTRHGLNLKAGGQSGGTNSDAVRHKLRKPKSEATKEKLRLAAIGRKVSDETREKHRQRMIGNKHLVGSSHMLGFKHSDETKDKIKEKRKHQIMPTGFKRPWSDEQKKKKSIAMLGENNPKYKDGKRCKGSKF